MYNKARALMAAAAGMPPAEAERALAASREALDMFRRLVRT